MARRPAGGVQWALLQIFGQGDMKEWSDLYWFSVTTGAISPTFDVAAATQALFTAMTAHWATPSSSTTNLRGAKCTFNDGIGSRGSEYYSNVQGTAITLPLPEDVAVVVRKQTANSTPSGKGRWYFSSPVYADCDGSYLNPTGISDWQAVAIDLKTAVTTGGVEFSPAHFSPKTGLLYAIVDTPVVGLLGTRRRRRGPF